MKGTRKTLDADARALARAIARSQTQWTALWHTSGTSRRVPRHEVACTGGPFLGLVQEQHRRNFVLWHEEDKARAPDATDAVIAAVKRAIDKLNQERNDLIERLDACFQGALQSQRVRARKGAGWNSETPGSIVDRLSILSLKVFHMHEQAARRDAGPEHVRKARARLAVLRRQRKDLARALEELLAGLFAGRKQMKLYRQFKMYNDPALNPAIYGARKA